MSDYEDEEWLNRREEEAEYEEEMRANCSCEWDWDNPVSRREPRFVQCDWCRQVEGMTATASEEYNANIIAMLEEGRRRREAEEDRMWAEWMQAEEKRVADARAANPFYDITEELREITYRSISERDVDQRIAACGEILERLCKPDGADFMAAHSKFRAVAAAKAAEFRADLADAARSGENGARLLEALDRFDALLPTLCENSHWKE